MVRFVYVGESVEMEDRMFGASGHIHGKESVHQSGIGYFGAEEHRCGVTHFALTDVPNSEYVLRGGTATVKARILVAEAFWSSVLGGAVVSGGLR